jgi:hypothetical protein
MRTGADQELVYASCGKERVFMGLRDPPMDIYGKVDT